MDLHEDKVTKMFHEIVRQLRPTIVLLILFTLLTGVVYPYAVTGVATVLFPDAAAGSLVKDKDGKEGSKFFAEYTK